MRMATMRCVKVFMIVWSIIIGAAVVRGVTVALVHALGMPSISESVQPPAR